MTMPSVECPAYPPSLSVKTIVADRFRQRFQNLKHHSQKCLNQHQVAQQSIRANEKRETNILRQRLQETKMKKGKSCKLEAPRSKIPPIIDDGDFALALRQAPKRKLPDCENLGFSDIHTQQQEPKRMKPDSQTINNNPDFSQLSVQIVAKYGNGTPTDQIKVNFQANRNGTDKDTVSVKVEQDNGRRGHIMNPHPNMHQETCQPTSDVNEASVPYGGNLSESEAFSRDIDDIIEYVDELAQQQPTLPRQLTPGSYPHNMTSSQNFQTQQQSQQYLVTSQSQHPHVTQRPSYAHITSSGQNLTPQMMPAQPNLGRQCKSEREDMLHMFRRRTPDNKPENPGIQRQTSHGIPHSNMTGSMMTQQSVQFGVNNFSASISSQQNITMNMMPQTPNNYPPTMSRQMSTNNNNMTSQHIHRLSQVAQFPTHDTPHHEPPRLFHPPTQQSQYESSAHLRQIAEKNRNRPVNMIVDSRAMQPLSHYHNEGPNVGQQMNHPISAGSQRLSHMDASVYSRAQYMQNHQRSGVMMQQSMHQESVMMRQYPLQQNQPPTYNRVPETHPQPVIPANQSSYPGNGNSQQSWNPSRWQQATSHNPVHHHRPQITPDQMQRPVMNATAPSPSYIPELDDLKFIDDIFNGRSG